MERTGPRKGGQIDEEDALALTVVSVLLGLVLAAAYHYFSMRLQAWVAVRRSAMVPAVTILSFLVRLTFLVVILVVLGLWSPLNILAVCLSFVALFTILNGLSVYNLVNKRKAAPPAVGGTPQE